MKNFWKKNIWKIIIAVVLVIVAAGVLAYFLSPDTVEAETVIRGDVQQSVTDVGYVEADDVLVIYAPVSGKISEVMYSLEDEVKEGDKLAAYDMTSFDEALKEAEISRDYDKDVYDGIVSQNAAYKELLSQTQNANTDYQSQYVKLMESRDQLLYAQNERENNNEANINALDAQFSIVTVALQDATAQLEAAQSEEEIAAAKKKIADLENQITINRQQIASISPYTLSMEEYGRYLSLVRQMELIDVLWSQSFEQYSMAKAGIVNESTLKSYGDAVELSELHVEQAKRFKEMAANGIVSRINGTIVERFADPGAYVEAGTPLFTLQPTSGYKATILISRYDIDYVKAGQKASVTVGNETYEGVVDSIAKVATDDGSGKPKVKVTVTFDDKKVSPIIGLEADITLFMEEKKDVLKVNEKGVYSDDEGDYVYVIEDGYIARRNIETGGSGGGYVEILSGLDEGESVITSPVIPDDIGSKVSAK